MRGYGGITRNRYVVIGDSIALGVRSGVTVAQALPTLVASSKQYSMVNAGVGGNTSTQTLARFESDCLAYGPSGICIGNICTNDPGAAISTSTASANITEMVRKAKITGARVTLWVPILAQDATLDASIAPFRTMMRGLASTLSCDLFDTYADMAALSAATQNSYFLEAAGSGQHLSPAGLAWAAGLVGSGAYANAFLSN